MYILYNSITINKVYKTKKNVKTIHYNIMVFKKKKTKQFL